MSNGVTGLASFAVTTALLLASCSERSQPDSLPSTARNDCTASRCATDEAQVRSTVIAFLDDVAVRRAALQDSIIYPDNTYATERLTNYGLDAGWDKLPIYDPPSAPLRRAAAGEAALVEAVDSRTWADGGVAGLADPPLSGAAPTSRAPRDWTLGEWIDAGRAAFFRYPAQRFAQVEAFVGVGRAVSDATLDGLGLWHDDERRVGGLVSVSYADGSQGVAYTCATCHARVDTTGQLIVGAPSQLAIPATSSDSDWGRGRVDVTADGQNNPVAIADLRATRVQRRLHYSGNLENSLSALAVRVETLLITSNQNAIRPPREVAVALAIYIWSLGEELARNAVGLSVAQQLHADSAEVFAHHCAACHVGEWGEGDWVPVAAVGTDPLVATSSARGTGGYRVPALLGFAERPLSHEALTVGLDDWLSGGTLAAVGESVGHAERTTGEVLSQSELAALTRLLRTAFPAVTAAEK